VLLIISSFHNLLGGNENSNVTHQHSLNADFFGIYWKRSLSDPNKWQWMNLVLWLDHAFTVQASPHQNA